MATDSESDSDSLDGNSDPEDYHRIVCTVYMLSCSIAYYFVPLCIANHIRVGLVQQESWHSKKCMFIDISLYYLQCCLTV